jgi:tRNA U55 pseudouridine synthase TruB
MDLNVISSKDISRGVVDGIIPVLKHISETPLECLGRLRSHFPMLINIPLSYAGRLDPLASGLMIVLSGSYNKKRETYLSLDKVYEVDVLLGLSTDTGDLMGMIDGYKEIGDISEFNLKFDKLKNDIKNFIGTHQVPYPAFSSKTIAGKPLHQISRDKAKDNDKDKSKGKDKGGGKDEDKCESGDESKNIPIQNMKIFSIDLSEAMVISDSDIVERAVKIVSQVNGDFRQDKIIENWKMFLEDKKRNTKTFMKIKIKVRCGSGSYMRTLSKMIGESLGSTGLAYSIHRVQVGDIKLEDAIFF